MKKTSPSGFKEIEHTADWELAVWAPDLNTLFVQCAAGMLSLMGMRLAQVNHAPHDRPVERTIHLHAADLEGLLVAFLSEILYIFEQHGLGFSKFDVVIQDNSLSCKCLGAPVLAVVKEIKAVTYHNLSIRQTRRGFEVHLVFDV